jgi:hypothetical protein
VNSSPPRIALPAHDAWVVSGLLAGRDRDGELARVTPDWSPVVSLMASSEPSQRELIFRTATALVGGPDMFLGALTSVDPDGPPPEAEPEPRCATMADIRRLVSDVRWVWPDWIPTSRIIGVAAPEGTGKTRVMLDVARRVWLGLAWPDGCSPTLPAGTPTVWLCSDGQQDEILEALPDLGIPDEAIVLPASVDDPYGGVSIDDPETFKWIARAVVQRRPALVVIDTLTTATVRDLCEQRTIAAIKGPLVDLAQQHQINVVLLLHVSKEGFVLGRRVGGITRVLWHLECPDPDHHPDRLKLLVRKSYVKKPAPLGVTIKSDGNEYDHEPPIAVPPIRGGRPPKARDKAIAFIRARLAEGDHLATELRDEWEAAGGKSTTYWRALEDLKADGEVVADGGTGTGKRMLLHLQHAETEYEEPPCQ